MAKPNKKSNSEVTSSRVAALASKILRDPHSGRLEKTAAASALTQHPDHSKNANKEVTGKRAASAASRVLRNPASSAAAKSAAGSALTQRPNKR